MTLLIFVLGAIFGGVIATTIMAMLFVSKRADENRVAMTACHTLPADSEVAEMDMPGRERSLA